MVDRESPPPSGATHRAGSSDAPRVPVLYIGGSWRSGSTLLNRLLGALPRVFAPGELRYLWQRGVVGNELCGCGTAFLDCPRWSAIGDRAFGGWERIDVDRVIGLQQSLERPGVLFPGWGRTSRIRSKHLAEYQAVLGRLYRAIRDVSGAEIVVDSSKNPLFAFVLKDVPAISLKAIHLVRDSRGVAYSARKRVTRPEVRGRKVYMPRYGVVHASLLWDAYNILFHVLSARGVPSVVTRYETLVRDPRPEISRLLRRLGCPFREEDLAFLGQPEIGLPPDHTVAGNPMRFARGRISLRPDQEWLEKMPARERGVVSILTAPLLFHYGYRLSRAGSLTAAS